MYLNKIYLENIAPIDKCSLELPFHDNGNPKPLIIVGENGTGKSILLSFIVNALIAAKQLLFNNTEVETGKVYKYRSPDYIKSGKEYYFAKLVFEENFQYLEWQLTTTRRKIEDRLPYLQNNEDWNKIPHSASELLWYNFNDNIDNLQELLDKNCLLYFPANRFEEPAWLNISNLNVRAEYSNIQLITGFSNRNIFSYAPLKYNQNWLLDILLDRELSEKQLVPVPTINNGSTQTIPLNAFFGYQGNCSIIYQSVIELLKIIIQTNDSITLSLGNRLARRISIIRNGKQWVPNIFQLSTGQTLVLNLFLTILRDFDLSNARFESLNEVRGIVIIDEIDLHLHSNLQYQILPQLIKLFPKVQFIITSHSPLFVLGLKKELSEDGIFIIEMPDIKQISAERFKEFEEAYSYFKSTESHEKNIEQAILESQKPIIFVEGDYDIRYLNKAAEVLGYNELLSKFSVKEGDGYGNLDKIWNSFKQARHLAELLPQIIIILYDCDTKKLDEAKGKVFKKVITTQNDTPIRIGIENLFPSQTIEKAEAYNRAFIDFTPETRPTVRGKECIIPAEKKVNKDEKGNLCNWLCEVGTKEDFAKFESIFKYLEQVIADNQGKSH